MKRFFIFFIIHLLSASVAYSHQSSNDWIHCWITGIELAKNPRENLQALEAYTSAIKAQDPNSISKHLYLYTERAKLFLKAQNFDSAIKDFSLVLNQPEANKDEVLDALWGRGQCYLAIGKIQEFENDRKRLDEIEPFITLLEENPSYLIIKMGNHVWRDAQSQERLVKVLLMQKKIKFQKDVIFTPSGMVIVKKNKT